MDRRALFFLASAAVCIVLLWPCPPDLRWVGILQAVWFTALAALSALDAFVRRRRA